jgi:hypothetical protein
MAEIIVTTTPVNLNVSTTQSNITVTDVETNVTVNVASLSSNITVSNEPVTVTIAPSIGVSNSEVRAALGNTNPILYDVNSGVFSFDADAAFNNAKVIGAIQSGNITLKQVQETYFNLGNTSSTTLSIDIANGTIQRTLLQSNVNQISFANLSPGGSATIFLEQDAFGFRSLDTSTNFNNWLFVDDYKTLSVGAGNVDSLSVIYDGSTYYASLTKLNASEINATFDNLTVIYNTISNVLTANTVTVSNGLTSTANSNFVGAVTLGNNLNVAGQLYADGNQIYIGQPGTGTNKIITGYSSTTAGQIFYSGADSTWYFRNNTAGGGTFKIPTSTTDLAQGTNLYFTTDQANSAIQNYKGTISTTGSITTTANVQGNYFIGNGSLLSGITSTSNAQLVSYIATVPLTVGGNLTVNGNINATGNINVQNVEDLYVRDQTIVLNANAASPANVQIVSNRPGLANTEIKWNEQTDRWTFTNDGTTYFPIPTSTTDLVEGANLYYTTARANSAIQNYQGNINTAGTLTAGATEINGNLTIDPSTGNAIITGQSTTDDLSMYFENIDLRIGSAFDEGRLFVRDNVSSNVLMSISAQEADNYTTRLRGDVIIGVDPNTGNTFGQFVFDVAQGDLDVAGGLEAETLFGNSAISSINGNIFTTNGNIYTTSGNVSGAYIKGNGSELTGLSTTQVSEGTNLYFTDARVRGNVSATTATGITYDSGTGVFSLASIPNSSLSNSTITINGTAVALGGTRTLTTSNIAEGTNLYYTTDRANTAIGAYQGSINTTGNIQGNYILGNGALLTGISTSSGTVTQVNTGENLTGGPITSTGTIGLANALANVNSITAQANVNFAVNTDKKLILSQKYKNTTTYSGNISGQGYAVIGGRLGTTIAHTGANAIPTLYITGGFSIAGTNEIANVTVQWQGNSAAASVSDIKSNYAFTSQFTNPGQTPFPQGTYVTSVDAANSKVFMSQIETVGLNYGVSNGTFIPAARDPETGLLISFISAQAAGVGAANVIVETLVHTPGLYAYPASGWDPSYFTYAIDTASDYNMSGTIDLAWAKTSIEGNKSILNSPYGLTLGSRTDASQMGTDDTRPRFGLNVLWDALTTPEEFGNVTPTTGVLLRQYNDPAIFTNLDKARSGPSVIFTVSEGNASQSFRQTFPKNNTELGKIAWVIPTNSNPAPSFNNPPTWINCLTGQTADIGGGGGGAKISGAGVYFANSPNVLNSGKGLYFANTKGNTLITGGAFGTSKINFGPMNVSDTTGNSASMYVATEGNKFAQIGYANTSTARGSEVAVTNGRRYGSPAVGDLQFTFNRIDNTNGTVPGSVSIFDNDWGYIPKAYYGDPADLIVTEQTLSLPTGTAIVPSGFTGDFGNAANGNTYYVENVGAGGGARFYYLYTDSALTTPLDLGIAGGAYGPGIYTYTLAAGVSGVTNKTWNIALEEQSNNLKFKANGTTVATITDGGNISATAFYGDGGNLTNVTATANTFNNIIVSGQSDVVASGSSNLTLVAGSGMSITTDAGTDTITFTSTGGYGNVEVANFLANGYGSNTISTTGNITAGNTIVNGVSFNTGLSVAPTSGQIRYNADYGTLQAGLNGSNVMLMGQDLVVYANNGEANTLLKGEVVYISGATGDKATIKRAINNTDANSATTIGIVKQDIVSGGLGYVVSQGVVDGLNLGAYTAGDKLYLGNVAGTFTNVKPESPAHYVFIGVVERANAGNGQIFVRVQNGFELDEIHDVNVTNVQPNDTLIRNSGNTLWINQNFGTTVTNSNITLKQYQETRVDLGSTGGSLTLNMANGSIFAMTATSSISNIALSNAGVGASGTLIITQDGTGGKTLTTTSAWKFANGAKTLSTAAGAIDIISFFTDGTTVYAALSKGYS